MTRLQKLRDYLQAYYAALPSPLLFHGWHHIVFVTDKVIALAGELELDDDDKELAVAAALVHDLNYAVQVNSAVSTGDALRAEILAQHGYTPAEIYCIVIIVTEADISTRGADISLEAQILSDADTLFKALPTTPLLFSSRYIEQNRTDLRRLAQRIVSAQKPLLEQDIYFYTAPYRERYTDMARQQVALWENLTRMLDDRDVVIMLDNAGISFAGQE